jgi:hypothetical protein
MTARAYNIMDELPAIFATVSGIDSSDVEIGWRDPANIDEGDLPVVLVYNPTTEEPQAPVFGVRSIEYGYAVVIVNNLDTEEATIELCEGMSAALTAATITNADTIYMNPGSIVHSEAPRRTLVAAFLFAKWEGV